MNLPIKSNDYSKTIQKSCLYVNQHKNEIGRIYYFHPLISYINHTTTKEKNSQYCHSFTQLENDVNHLFKTGDIIIRDSKFGSIEQGLPFDKLNLYPWLVPVKYFYVNGSSTDFSSEKQAIIIYQVVDRKIYFSNQSRFLSKDTIVPLKNRLFRKKLKVNQEFYNLHKNFFIPSYEASNQSLLIHYKINAREPLFLVVDNGHGSVITNQLLPEKDSIEIVLNDYSKKALIYLYNPSKQNYTCELKGASWRLQNDIGILSTEN